MSYRIFNKTKGVYLVQNASIAQSFLQRLFGLLPKKNLQEEEALIFYNAPSIHMFFMRFPIDVIFLDENMRIVKIAANLKPWQMSTCLKAKVTIELSALKTAKTSTDTGDILDITKA